MQKLNWIFNVSVVVQFYFPMFDTHYHTLNFLTVRFDLSNDKQLVISQVELDSFGATTEK